MLLGLSHDLLDLLRTRTSSDEKGVRHIDDDEIVYTKARDETAGAWYNDTSGDLFSENCRLSTLVRVC